MGDPEFGMTGVVAGQNSKIISACCWLEGTNLATESGVGNNRGSEDVYTCTEAVLSGMYSSMESIINEASDNVIAINIDTDIPKEFNELQGSYLLSEITPVSISIESAEGYDVELTTGNL